MRQPHKTALLATLVAALIAGCGTAPLSFVDNAPPVKLLPTNHYPVRVVAVDGIKYLQMPVQLFAGERSLVLQAPPQHGLPLSNQRTVMFTVKPCTRYEFVAVRKSPMDPNWELLVHRKDAVSLCQPDEEIRKGAVASALAGAAKGR